MGRQIYGLGALLRLVQNIATIGAIGLGLFVAFYGYWRFMENDFEKRVDQRTLPARGQFGDQFGGLNVFFTALGSALLLYTIISQGRDLRDQQEDIERQMEHAKIQGEALIAQGKELGRAAAANECQVLVAIAQMEIMRCQASIEASKVYASAPHASAQLIEVTAEEIRNEALRMAQIITDIRREVNGRARAEDQKSRKAYSNF